jgi:hypothetical protein
VSCTVHIAAVGPEWNYTFAKSIKVRKRKRKKKKISIKMGITKS